MIVEVGYVETCAPYFYLEQAVLWRVLKLKTDLVALANYEH
ncbi:hypothetical protein OH686_20530 [Pseudomonas sp. SO81]|nr:hypothetical protein OH686_20530 [Pseudomonas sp. SO81]